MKAFYLMLLAVGSMTAGAQQLMPGRISPASMPQSTAPNVRCEVMQSMPAAITQKTPRQGNPAKADDAAQEYTCKFKITPPDGVADFKLSKIGLYNEEWGFLMLEYQPEYDEIVDLSKPVTAPHAVEAGNYEMLVWGIAKTGEFSYRGYCTHATVELKSEGQQFTADFNDCKNRLRINGNQGNGEPFPQFDATDENEPRSLTMQGRFAYGEAYYDFFTSGTADFEMYVSDFAQAGKSFYEASFDYMDFNTMSGTSCAGGIIAPFLEDFEGTIQQKYMKLLTNKTSLSPADKAMGVTSMVSGSFTLDVDDLGGGFVQVSRSMMASCSYIDGTPASEMTVYKDMGINHEPNFNWEDCGFTGFMAYGKDESVYKYSGPLTYFDNEPMLVGWEENYNDGEYTFVYPREVFNIDPRNHDVVNYLNPLFAVVDPNINKDWDGADKIVYPSIDIRYQGPFYEYLSAPSELLLSEIYYDDQKLNTIDDLQDKAFEGHRLKFCAEYPDGWVQDAYAAKFRQEVTINLSSERGADMHAPKLMAYQVRDYNGHITGRLGRGDETTLYLAMQERDGQYSSTDNFTLTVSVAPQGTDQWIELTPSVSELLPFNNGSYHKYSLRDSRISDDQWYCVRIQAVDPAGNSMTQYLDYCFNYCEQSGIGTIGADSTDASGPVRYYNLNGIEITQPQTPGVYILRQGSETRKVLIR